MHVHEPLAPPTTFRQFRREYAMIVLSILTALGFERTAVYLHDRASAQASRGRIEQEINDDLAELRKASTFNSASAATMRSALQSLVVVLKSANPNKAKEAQIITESMKQFSLQLPTWQRDAWDAAVADQTVTHLDPRDLRRYAELYSGATDMNDAVHIMLTGGIFDRIADISVDLRLGDVNGRSAAQIMARFLAAAQQIVQVQQTLLDTAANHAKAPGGP